MVPEESSLLLFKFSDYKWLKLIKEGNINFSCPGNYIDIAKRTGNNEQGDVDEGVFARLKKDDPKIGKAAKKLKDDLEIIDEHNGYVKLRRRSSYFIPTFCFYSYRGSDLLNSSQDFSGYQQIPHWFDDRMYKSFGQFLIRNVLNNDSYPASLMIHVKPFKLRLQLAMCRQGINFKMGNVNYTEFEKDEFYIEPDEKRSELFYKFPQYSYQKEARICLYDRPFKNIYSRLSVNIGSLEEEDFSLNTKEIYFSIGANIIKN
ncbi:hypothetical protein [Priestia megaterium]|uniref:hypothetical protein n=1 Tax=Priestia megaterium TaxID=1404 RepID=UPI002E1FC9A2|nr:hypothetical protein [Priestia megaterium]